MKGNKPRIFEGKDEKPLIKMYYRGLERKQENYNTRNKLSEDKLNLQ